MPFDLKVIGNSQNQLSIVKSLSHFNIKLKRLKRKLEGNNDW